MKNSKHSDAPQLKLNWKHIALVVVHFAVFLHFAFSGEFITAKGTAGALPQTLLFY
jgi:hypothetical protein